MHIDNTLSTAKNRLAFIITGIMAIALLIFGIYTNESKTTLFAVACACAVIHAIMIILNPGYIGWIDDNNSITIKSVHAYPLFRKYLSYKIQKSLISDYRIEKKFFGLKKFLCITVKGKNKKGEIVEYNYKPINLTGVKNSDINKIESELKNTTGE